MSSPITPVKILKVELKVQKRAEKWQRESRGERECDPDVHPPLLILMLSLRIWMAAHQINSIIKFSLHLYL